MARIFDACPLCGADLSGDLVSRRIALVNQRDGNLLQCPECLSTWRDADPGPTADG